MPWQCEGLGDGQLESLSHVFLHCPVVHPAVAWLQALWGRVVEGQVPPVDARVLLAGDRHRLGPALAGARLVQSCGRTCVCCSAYSAVRSGIYLRCCRAAEGQVFTAATVVALVKSWVQRAI